MTGPLMILAVLSLAGGFIPLPHFLEPMFPKVLEESEKWLEYTAVASGLLGISLAYLFYVASPSLADAASKNFNGLHKLLYHKYYVDEAYDAAVVEPIVQGSRSVLWKGFDSGAHRRHRQRHRPSRHEYRRGAPAIAIRKY